MSPRTKLLGVVLCVIAFLSAGAYFVDRLVAPSLTAAPVTVAQRSESDSRDYDFTILNSESGRKRVTEIFGSVPISATSFAGHRNYSNHDDNVQEDIQFSLSSVDWELWKGSVAASMKVFRSTLESFEETTVGYRATYGDGYHRLEVSYWAPTVRITRRYSD